ncbi:MAG TPA: hypothetical protein VIU38_02190 [Anaerolineales bacterium]
MSKWPADMNLREAFAQRVTRGLVRHFNNARITDFGRRVAASAPPAKGRPVVLFKASTGIDDLSWNSGFHLLTGWALRLQGVPIVNFACNAGMSRCVLGTNRDRVDQAPPCRSCVYQSRALYTGLPVVSATGSKDAEKSRVHWFGFSRDTSLAAALEALTLAQLMQFRWPFPRPNSERPVQIPLGSLCVPGLRWILRRHNLVDDENTRFLLREYILSGWNVACEFSSVLDSTDPLAVVVFNGQFFPEAVARFVAQKRGVRVITHEVGLQPASAFFTEGEATAYPIRIPQDFELTPDQNGRLDAYLEQRMHGKFSMAGIEFWPSMRGLDAEFLARAARFRQLVPIFTNVIFDTSQPHANTVFPDMFVWLDMILGEVKSHPDTLFVIRAHPDETRLRKESRETVQDWVERNGIGRLDNVSFVGPKEYVSSYELIQRAKFVLVYNSTIGLEASILGAPVLCGGRARFTQYPIVFFPQTPESQLETMRRFLAARTIVVPDDFRRNARRFLYFQLYRTSLPFNEFLEPSVRRTQTRLKTFKQERLAASPALKAIERGLLDGGDFLLPEEGPPTGALP